MGTRLQQDHNISTYLQTIPEPAWCVPIGEEGEPDLLSFPVCISTKQSLQSYLKVQQGNIQKPVWPVYLATIR